MKKIMIFGSTGSIGRNALDVIRRETEKFKVLGLCANSDLGVLISQIKEFRPSYVCISDEKRAEILEKIIDKKITLFKGTKGLKDFSSIACDISVMAISGISCLRPLLVNMQYAKRIALANKESVVTAGNFVFSQAKKMGTEIIPVDSEINALFQLFEQGNAFERVYLTASGGSLIDYKKKDLAKVNAKAVLSHPTWRMGKRITVDSATLVNKAFEVVETHYFFELPYDNIDVVVHRQALIHALVQCPDKNIFACLYPTDMRIPIAFALYYPKRRQIFEGVNFNKFFSLSFEPLKKGNFALFELVIEAAKRKDNSLAILNACDEIAIEYFLKAKIKFTDIHRVMQHLFEHYPSRRLKNVEDIFYWDNWGREKTINYLDKLIS
ncbi:MAG: 1-deoxy-D-xylulose-5-phosphate reductoisomerase [Candidatus Omnitrophota bacterium]|nr:1-deoxy-D-xylulose-5-phosphate reductoisomerase [Candidatus Omnitrophota bacterium]